MIEVVAVLPWGKAEEYATILGIHPATARKLLLKLEKEGLVARANPHHLDGVARSVWHLTPAGFKEAKEPIGGVPFWQALAAFEITLKARQIALSIGYPSFLRTWVQGWHAFSLVIRGKGLVSPVLVEVDNGMLALRYYLRRLRKLASFLGQKEWFLRPETQPSLLVSTTSPQRLEKIRRFLQRNPSPLRAFFSCGRVWYDSAGIPCSLPQALPIAREEDFWDVPASSRLLSSHPAFNPRSVSAKLAMLRLSLPSPSTLWTLFYLAFYPASTSEHLATLQAVSREEIARRLACLAKLGLAFPSQNNWFLTEKGLRFLAFTQGAPLSHFSRSWGYPPGGPPKKWNRTAGHATMVLDFLCRLTEIARSRGDSLKIWDGERTAFCGGTPPIFLYPDGHGVYVMKGGGSIRFFFEWDNGTTSYSSLQKKFQRYRELARRWPEFEDGPLPVLLVASRRPSDVLFLLRKELEASGLRAFVAPAQKALSRPDLPVWIGLDGRWHQVFPFNPYYYQRGRR